MDPLLPKKRSFIKPFTLSPNPKSRMIIQDFIDSKLSEAEVDTSWARDPRLVYERLHKYLSYDHNRRFNIRVTIRKDKVILSRLK